MATIKDLVVAIELGSSSIRGIAGKKNDDGSIHIASLVQLPVTNNAIRNGVIHNMVKTVQSIKTIVNQLEEETGLQIDKVYVGIAGKSLRTKKNSVSRQLNDKVIITHEIIDNLKDTNRDTNYADLEILDVVPQEYRLTNDQQLDPIGFRSDHIEGRFLNVVARNTVRADIKECFENAKVEVADYFISPLALAESCLSETEKRSGCALVNMGAETTTVIVYKNNILRHLAVIPLGGSNITRDLVAGIQMDEDEAESLKIRFGSAILEDDNEDNKQRNILVNNDRTVEQGRITEITAARQYEIIANVKEQIKNSGYADSQLLAGLFVMGGASNISKLDKCFAQFNNFNPFEKIKYIKTPQVQISNESSTIMLKDSSLNTLLALLAKGNAICTHEVEIIAEPEPEPVTDDTTETNGENTEHKEPENVVTEQTEKKKKEKGTPWWKKIGKAIEKFTTPEE